MESLLNVFSSKKLKFVQAKISLQEDFQEKVAENEMDIESGEVTITNIRNLLSLYSVVH